MVRFKRKVKLLLYRFQLISMFSLLLLVSLLPVPLINGGEDDGATLHTRASLKDCKCPYDNLHDLITKSPVIVKALGAKIFNDRYVNFESNRDILAHTGTNQIKLNMRKIETFNRFVNNKIHSKNNNKLYNNKNNNYNKLCGNNNNYDNNVNLITLTPETIYKGASILKIDAQADKPSKFYFNDSFRRRRQLNAEFGPIECFNQETLNLLPTQLIVFGKLISNNQQQQQQHSQQKHQQQQQQQQQPNYNNYNNFDTLQIYPNGIHSWSPELENYIWKHLGWDNWSDFTLCSVTCGKGVQQRFRRCLFDNISSSPSAAAPSSSSFQSTSAETSSSSSSLSLADGPSSAISAFTPITFVNNNLNNNQNGTTQKSYQQQSQQQSQQQQQEQLNSPTMTNHQQEMPSSSAEYGTHNEYHLYYENNESMAKQQKNPNTYTSNGKIINGKKMKFSKNKKSQHKKRTTKGMTTLSCEGYNIEQRNCNMFDCDDYLTDLLKFARRSQSDGTASPAVAVQSSQTFNAYGGGDAEMNYDPIKSSAVLLSSSSSLLPPQTSGVQLQDSGFIQDWKNSINFTIMITLKLKASSRQSTIFELRNATHNLYLVPCDNGLKLFQERDEVTEMLPLKFDLYDNRWHQIAISVLNGDFITMYVDCLWTNSYVVSKHLFALPENADVEIGREYAGDEIQQLLILPGNKEKQQCSIERTSINEVKRYIIDTFIEDYSN